MKYKDQYPTFWKYWNNEVPSGYDILSQTRREGKIAFLKKFIYCFRHSGKSFKKTFHDYFIGTRIL